MSQTRTLSGLPASPGIAIGEPVLIENRPLPVIRVAISPERVEEEINRLREAAVRVGEHLAALREAARARMGAEFAAILEAHRLLLFDPALTDEVEAVIRRELVCAEWALEEVVRRFLQRFDQLADVYLRERQVDLLDVAAHWQRELQGKPQPQLANEQPRVLLADDIPPSQAIQLAAGSVIGFASEAGGLTSHTTIIAKSLGIPAVVGVEGLVESARRGELVIVDGFEGHVLINPDPALVEVYRWREEEHRRRRQELLQQVHLPAATTDGHQVRLLANVDLLHEVESATLAGAEGVGLFRSEFLFMQTAPLLPDEDTQYQAYRKLLAAFPGLPVTIRTYDLGGRKLAREILGSMENNPALGLRGVRLSLARPDFFRTQLRALLRVAAEFPGQLRVMVPMVAHLEEVRAVKILLQRLAQELREEGVTVPPTLALGAMIEVPAAALLAEHFARELDFLSIGTNDLTQYTLAVDRANREVARTYRPFHPAVLRLLERVITAGRRAGIPVSLCGELASDPLAVPVLIGLGLPEFSMHPPALPVIRRLIRGISLSEARRIARKALSFASAKEVEEFLWESFSGLLARLQVRVRV
ncbi:MAG: phosphoenolpyruvate--protein phosphotransferase [Thermoanaerobaculum sp.]|nr:phosphoenolpyruvate--protein phosphotransferase [Thermoanaerobaculum sp.]MDW7966964.1 phosphoenolpyruvate--protein phosphotransferase [Thermoanaerobaculum sp.]